MFYCCNLFYFVLFKSTVLHCIPFYFYCYLTFCNIFCSILLYSIMFWFVPFYSRVLYSILLASSSALSAFYSYSIFYFTSILYYFVYFVQYIIFCWNVILHNYFQLNYLPFHFIATFYITILFHSAVIFLCVLFYFDIVSVLLNLIYCPL